MPDPLTPGEMFNALADLPGWSWENNSLVTTRQFESFRAAIGFMLRASFVCDEMDHHPDWTIIHHTVTIRLRTHDAGNRVTALDVELARKLEKLVREV